MTSWFIPVIPWAFHWMAQSTEENGLACACHVTDIFRSGLTHFKGKCQPVTLERSLDEVAFSDLHSLTKFFRPLESPSI